MKSLHKDMNHLRYYTHHFVNTYLSDVLRIILFISYQNKPLNEQHIQAEKTKKIPIYDENY